MPRLDRYQDHKVYDALAGDYVLGTMGGRARRRFLELMAERGYIREAAAAWERRLHPLGVNIIPITPHPRVWRKIRREIHTYRAPQAAGLWSNLWIWRSIAGVAVLACVGLTVWQTAQPPPMTPIPAYVAVLVDAQQAPAIVATASRDTQRLTVLMMQAPKLGAESDFELWAIPGSGQAPVSIAVLPRNHEILIDLDDHDRQVIPATGAFAISREPKGGSPTGAPTGPVVYQGELVTL
ncbi:MAG: anti-sigma factor [Gammaproteobacteria bacterium]